MQRLLPLLSNPFADESAGELPLPVQFVDAEQVADGVLVLDPVEPAQCRAAVREASGPGLGLDLHPAMR